MRRISLVYGGLLGALSAVVFAALDYIGGQLAGLPRASFALFDWMTRVLPGSIISLFIDTMVKVINGLQIGPTAAVAKRVEQGTAILLFVVIGVLFGVFLAALAQRQPARTAIYGILAGFSLAVLFSFMQAQVGFPPAGITVSILWMVLIFMLWGWVLAKMIAYITIPPSVSAEGMSRRQFLYLVGAGTFTVLVSAVGVSLLSQKKQQLPITGAGSSSAAANTADQNLAFVADTSGPAKSPPLAALKARFAPAPGTRQEITPPGQFYRVDINLIPPAVDGKSWRLGLDGLVDKPLSLSLDDIRARPAISQAITLECISNPVGGDLISTGVWKGVWIKDILEEAGLKPGAKEIYIEAADGFYESVPMADAMDDRTLLVYEMDGQPLSTEHGYPLRIYIPNRFGMKQPKWITKMTVIDRSATGYWVERGWDARALASTTSVIDTVDTNDYDPQKGVIPIGGIAYAGARGISKVEIQVDRQPWQQAELRTPAVSPLTWVQWRYFWKVEPGSHTFRVQATDGAGNLQEPLPADPGPGGATGLNSSTQFIPNYPK